MPAECVPAECVPAECVPAECVPADWMLVSHTESAGLLSAHSLHLRLCGGVLLSCAGWYTIVWLARVAVHTWARAEALAICKSSIRDEEAAGERDCGGRSALALIRLARATIQVRGRRPRPRSFGQGEVVALAWQRV